MSDLWKNERKAFPIAENYIYLANAATVPLRVEITKSYQDFALEMQNQADLIWGTLPPKLDAVRSLAAEVFSGTTEDWGFGVSSSHNIGLISSAIKERSGLGEVVTLTDEFPSSFVPWRYHGFELNFIESRKGFFNQEDILNKLNSNTKAVVLSAIQFSTGMRFDLKPLSEELKKRNIPFIVNATQALGAFPIDVLDIGCDALVCTSHKWLGAGLGLSLLYTSKDFRKDIHWPLAGHASFDDPEFYGLSKKEIKTTAFNEVGTMPFANMLAIGESLKIIKRIGIDRISQRITELSTYLVDQANDASIEVLSPRDNLDLKKSCNSGIVYLKLNDPAMAEEKLKEKNIITNHRRGALRVSTHYYNNHQDIDKLFEVLKGLN